MADMLSSLKKMRVAELREKCAELELDTKGTKAVILSRIKEHLGIMQEEMDDTNNTDDLSQNTTNNEESKEDLFMSFDNQSVSSKVKEDINQLSPIINPNTEPKENTQIGDLQTDEMELDFVNDEHSVRTEIFLSPTVSGIYDPTNTSLVARDLEEPKEKQQENFNYETFHPDTSLEESNRDTGNTSAIETNPTLNSSPKNKTQKPLVESEIGDELPLHFQDDEVHLDTYNCDLHLVLTDDEMLTARNLLKNELSSFWCGVKASYGASRGKFYFSVQYIKDLELPSSDVGPCTKGLRVGFSSQDFGLHLGDTGKSVGYDSSGRLYACGKIVGTGTKFSPGDTVVVLMDLDSVPVSASFIINGTDCGIKTTIESDFSTFFPHFYFKNVEFKVSFGQIESPPEEFVCLNDCVQSLIKSNRPPLSCADCEVLVMVGVAAAGKTYWANEYVKKFPDKSYFIVGRSLLHDRWRNVAQERRIHLSERKVSRAIMKLLCLAQNRPRNYIFDQTNCTVSTRKRRLEAFKDFGSIKAILVLPSLSDLQKRLDTYRESLTNPSCDDRVVFDEDIAELKNTLTLPTKNEGFDEIKFVDCTEDSANLILDDYKYDANKYKKANAARENTQKNNFVPRKRQRSGRRSPPRRDSRKAKFNSKKSFSRQNNLRPMLASAPRRRELYRSPPRTKYSGPNHRSPPPRKRSPPRTSRNTYADPYSSYEAVPRQASTSRYRPGSFEPYSPSVYRPAPSGAAPIQQQITPTSSIYRVTDYSNYSRNISSAATNSRPSVGSDNLSTASSYQGGNRPIQSTSNVAYSGYTANALQWPGNNPGQRRSDQIHTRTTYPNPTTSYQSGRPPGFYSNATNTRGGYGGYTSSSYPPQY